MRSGLLFIGILSVTLAGCAAGVSESYPAGSASSTSAVPTGGSTTRDTQFNPTSANPPQPGRPVAYVDGKAVELGQLQQPLIEAAGGQVLAEWVLDTNLQQRLQERGVAIGSNEINAERELLLRSLSEDANQAQRLLEQLRETRGLGQQRFSQLLWRNAAMRALVDPEVEVSEGALRQAYDLIHGPRFEARLIVTPTPGQASQLARQARSGASFADLAIAHSTDPSRAQGGLLPAISPVDATFPSGVRQALATLKPGEISDPVALEDGYAVLQLVRILPGGAVSFDDVKQDLTQRVRTQGQRMHMQRLARQILGQAKVTITDPALQASFSRQKQRLLAAE